jgi:hypothetical protein
MLEYLARFPRFNGFLLGILQGIPQGILVLDQEPWILSALSILDQHLVFIISFGFLSPPVFFFLGRAIRGEKRSKWWMVLSRYMNIYDMMFWGCVSFAAGGFYALNKAGANEGFGLCILFAAFGGGFFVVGLWETHLLNKNSTNESRA